MGLLDDFEKNTMGRTTPSGIAGDNQISFRPDFSAGSMGRTSPQQSATPGNNIPEDPGAEQRKKLIQQSVPGAHTPYEADMRDAATKFNVPYEALFGILNTESGFNPNAIPKDPKTGRVLSSAKGIAQYINSTAAQTGLNPMDPKASIYRTAQDLRANTDFHGGDLNLGIASHGVGKNAARTPKGFEYANLVTSKFPKDSNIDYNLASPGTSIGGPVPSLAGMDKDQMLAFNESMPEARRSIHAIRGNAESWFNPQQSREFATLGESLRGQPGEATYATQQAERIATDKNTALKDATTIEQTLKNQGAMDQLTETMKILAEEGPGKSAKDVLAVVEGGANKPATPGGLTPAKDPDDPYIPVEDAKKLEEARKRKAAQYARWYGNDKSALF